MAYRHSSRWGLVVTCALVLFSPVPAAAQAGPSPPPQSSPPLTYPQVLEMATAQNLDLEAVRRTRSVREAQVTAAGQVPNPEFSAEATRDTPHGDVTIALPVELAGTRSKRVAVANAGLAMADVDMAAALRQLRRETRLAFYGLLSSEEAVTLAQGMVDVAQKFRDVARARVDEGAAPRREVMQADLGVVRASAELELAKSSRRATQAELNALLNRPPTMDIALAGEASDVPPLPTLDQAVAEAMVSNVDLLQLDREAGMETATLALLKRERAPIPTFSVGAGFDSPEFDVGPHAGFSLAIPIFSRNQGEIAGSLARTNTIAARRTAARRQVESKVFAALERVKALRAQEDALYTTAVPTATTLESLAEESYRLGRDSILAVLEAQRSLRDVKIEYLQALLSLQAAVADLEEVLGGPIQ